MAHRRVTANIKKLAFGALTALIASTAAIIITSGTRTVSAATDTCTWTGNGADSNITTAGNWTGCDNGNVPEYYDSLEFPAGPTNKTVTIDSALRFTNVIIDGSGYTISPASSETFGINGNLSINGDDTSIVANTRFFPASTSTITTTGSNTSFSSYIVVQPTAANTILNFDTQTDLSVPMISQTATGAGSSIQQVNKTGVGTLEITGSAISGLDSTNGIVIYEGTWKCDSIYCLGDSGNEITFDDFGESEAAGLYLGGGNGSTIANPITFNDITGQKARLTVAANTTLTGNMTVDDSATIIVSGGHTATIQSAISIAANKTLAAFGGAAYSENTAAFSGNISGEGGLIFSDITSSLTGTNSYNGDTTLSNAGGGTLLTVTGTTGLGNASGSVTVSDGTTLEFDNPSATDLNKQIYVTGTGVGGSYPGAIVNASKYTGLTGQITLTGDTTLHNNSSDQYLGLRSQISGNYDLTLSAENDGIGFVIQSSGATNSYKDLIVNGTYLDIFPDNGDLVIPNNLTVNAVNGNTSLVVMERDNTIADDAVITLNNDTSQQAVLLNSGVEDAIGALAGDGTVSITDSDGHFLLGGGNTSGTFSGTINGYANSQIDIVGGTWTFTGTNADVGNGFESYYVNGGTMLANASNTTLGSSPFSISSGVIGGDGTIGQISVYSGTVSPGNSPGCLSVTGDVAFADSSSNYKVQLQNSTECTGYDRLTATGTIYLNDTTFNLELLPDFAATNGQVFTILQASAIDGTFTGLADGDTVQIDGNPFTINYTATTVTLTYTGATIAAPASAASLAATGMRIITLMQLALALIAASILALTRHHKFSY